MNIKMNAEVENLCRYCKENNICDSNKYLCEDCYNKFCDAVNDTLPNLDRSYNPNITAEERNRQIALMGTCFNLSLEETVDLIDSLE